MPDYRIEPTPDGGYQIQAERDTALAALAEANRKIAELEGELEFRDPTPTPAGATFGPARPSMINSAIVIDGVIVGFVAQIEVQYENGLRGVIRYRAPVDVPMTVNADGTGNVAPLYPPAAGTAAAAPASTFVPGTAPITRPNFIVDPTID